MSHRVATVLCSALLAGCMARGGYPPIQRTLVGATAALDEAQIGDLLAAAPRLPVAPRAALLVTDAYSGPGRLAESDRAALIELLRTRLDRPPFASVRLVPTAVAPSYSGGDDLSLATLRSAAARMQGDVLVVVTTAVDTDTGTNPLSVTYLALLPALFVPGSDVGAWASAEACAIDVRSGVFLACASGHGTATDGYVIPTRIAPALRTAVRDAVDDALAGLAAQVTGQVERWCGAPL